jgi:hypothetical protein
MISPAGQEYCVKKIYEKQAVTSPLILFSVRAGFGNLPGNFYADKIAYPCCLGAHLGDGKDFG